MRERDPIEKYTKKATNSIWRGFKRVVKVLTRAIVDTFAQATKNIGKEVGRDVKNVAKYQYKNYQNNKIQKERQNQRTMSQGNMEYTTSKSSKISNSFDRNNTKEVENMFESRNKKIARAAEWQKFHEKELERGGLSSGRREYLHKLSDLLRQEKELLQNDQINYSQTDYFAIKNTSTNIESSKDRNFQKGVEESRNFGNEQQFRTEYRNKYDVILTDISKYQAMLNRSIEKNDEFASSFWAGKVNAAITQDDVKEIREMNIPVTNRGYGKEDYFMSGGEKRMAAGVREVKMLGDDVASFARKMVEKQREINPPTPTRTRTRDTGISI